MKLILAVITLTVFVTWMSTCNAVGPSKCPKIPCEKENPICGKLETKAGSFCELFRCPSALDKLNCHRKNGNKDLYLETDPIECSGLPIGKFGACADLGGLYKCPKIPCEKENPICGKLETKEGTFCELFRCSSALDKLNCHRKNGKKDLYLETDLSECSGLGTKYGRFGACAN